MQTLKQLREEDFNEQANILYRYGNILANYNDNESRTTYFEFRNNYFMVVMEKGQAVRFGDFKKYKSKVEAEIRIENIGRGLQ